VGTKEGRERGGGGGGARLIGNQPRKEGKEALQLIEQGGGNEGEIREKGRLRRKKVGLC